MKRFLFKTAVYLIPFTILYCISLKYYSAAKEPDLLRIGLIPNVYQNYRPKFLHTANRTFDNLSNSNLKKYKILTIGDSFSDQDVFGYQNILANDFSVVHVDKFISTNPIQTLINFANGDFFDNYNIEYVILQHVERHFIDSIARLRINDKIMLYEIDSIIVNKEKRQTDYANKFFSRTTIKFPLYDLPKYFLQKNYLGNKQVYNVELVTDSLFSNHSNKLFFYNLDLESTTKNNMKENVDSLNRVLNLIALKLRLRNIKLIVLPSPDKYDLYYDFISERKRFTKPLFFELMKFQIKDYIYIDSKTILTSKLKTQKDIYFYDDTHWSPIASKIIVENIKDTIDYYEKK